MGYIDSRILGWGVGVVVIFVIGLLFVGYCGLTIGIDGDGCSKASSDCKEIIFKSSFWLGVVLYGILGIAVLVLGVRFVSSYFEPNANSNESEETPEKPEAASINPRLPY